MSHCSKESIAEILQHINPDYFRSFDTRKESYHPGLMCVACADPRLVPSQLFAFPPGEEFVRKPIGGFLPCHLAEELGLNAWFSLTAGIKKISKIIIVAHSDCAAGNAALKYPTVEAIPDDHPELRNIRAIQNYLFMIGEDLAGLAEKCWAEARRDEAIATDLMTKALAVKTLHNLMNYKVYDNRSKTVAEAIVDENVDVSLLYVDLGETASSGQILRKPRIEYYDVLDGEFRELDPRNVSEHASLHDDLCHLTHEHQTRHHTNEDRKKVVGEK